jgi:septal ring factor EnvC (AmiA/AmiB activator)
VTPSFDSDLANWIGGGTGVGLGIMLARAVARGIAWLATFITGRQDKRQAQLDALTQELIETLRTEIRDVREELREVKTSLRECERKHAESEAKVLKLEATLAGLGDARQHAALIVAAEKKRESKK